MKRRLVSAFALAAIAAGLQITHAQAGKFVPVTDELLRSPKPADWIAWRGGRGASGYSPLTQINRSNVRRLRLAWAWSIEAGALEAEPLVYNGVMYLPHPGDVVQALDARTGTPIWEYRRERPKDVRGGPVGNRSLALYRNTVLLGTSDAHLVALDATTGRPVWDVAVADYREGIGYGAGPIAGDGRVYASLTCGGGPA